METMMTEETKPITLSYEERNAVDVLRKSIKRKPGIIKELMKGASYDLAVSVLLQAKTELSQLLEVNRAFSEAAAVLAKQQKESDVAKL
jgi:hypothetical protein